MLALSTRSKGSIRPMLEPTTVAGQRRGPRIRLLLVAVLVLAFTGATTSSAWASLGIQSYNDPAGDPTVHRYSLLRDGQPIAGLPNGNPFTLVPGEDRNYGPPAGTYIWKALPAAGWKVTGILCTSFIDTNPDDNVENLVPRATRPGEFTYDVVNGQVTIDHRFPRPDDVDNQSNDDHICAFTSAKAGGGTGGGGGSTFSPTLPSGGGATIGAAMGPALLRITSGRFLASLKVTLGRTSVINAKLLKGKTVVGSARVVKKAGTYTVKVHLKKRYRERWRAAGRKKVMLRLKITVLGSNRATKVFSSGVIVKLV